MVLFYWKYGAKISWEAAMIDCTSCGACCLNETPSIKSSDKTPLEFINSEEGCMKDFEGACICFDAGKRNCKIYELRPYTCTALQVGSPECLLSRLWAAIDLDWFGSNPKAPPKGAFDDFCNQIVFGTGLSIVSIAEHNTDEVQILLEEYNSLVITEPQLSK